jgi:diguanylate cyclase (GGDEF)-like protein
VSHGAVVVLRDTTRERLMLERLGWMASHDSLTRLPNRREFESRVGAAIDTVLESPGGVEHVVMLLDLDQFKIVNDTDGHAAGDELLRQIATVLRARIGPDDTLARMGGDEFAVLLRGCSRDEGERKAETLRRAIQSVSFEWQGRAHSGTTASIGLVHVHAQGLRTIAEIMSAADMACYVAKERGRDQVSVFHAEDQRFTDRFGDMGWPQRIRQAIDEGRMVLYSQPLAGLQPETAGHRRCELLLRLHDEQGALVSPGAFLPAAERYGLMPQIDRWVVDHALRIIASRRRAAPTEHVSYAINLSGSAFGDANFLAEVQRLFDHHAVPFACVCFEITETQAVADLEAAARFIAVLRARGATFALDDFGAGMSSMSYLKHLPVDYLKIDGKLVKDIVTDKVNHAMVEMISRLAQTLGLRTVGEFAEDAAITSALRDIGVHYAQGYGVARPGPFEAVPWVEATTAAAPPAGQADGPAGAAAQAVQRAHDVNELTPEVALLSR